MNDKSDKPDISGSVPPHSVSSAAKTAMAYAKARLLTVPIPPGEKAPKIFGWQNLRITEDTIGDHFGDEPANIGILLGDSGLVDVDLDVPEAALLAPSILPQTSTFGRTSKKTSHYIYRTEDRRPSERFQIMGEGGPETIVEYRDSSKNGTSIQTVFPGSTHPSGEPIEWDAQAGQDFTSVDADELMDDVKTLAFMVVVLRMWPRGSGGRHDLAGALGSILARAGLSAPLDVEAIGRIVYAIAEAADDDEPGDRANYAKESAEKARDNCAVTGIPTLADLLCSNEMETKMLSKALSWIGYRAGISATVPSSEHNGTSDITSTKESQAAQLVRLATEHETEFWCAPNGTSYITFKSLADDRHLESHPLHSTITENFLRRLFYTKARRSARSHDIQDAQAEMMSICQFEGGVHETAVRVATAEVDGERRIYLDLGNPAWEVVEIRPGQWEVITAETCPFRMVRSLGTLALPTPARGVPVGGGIKALQTVLNVEARDLPLVMAWLVGTLYPVGEMPIIAFAGEQGTGKSTAAKALRSFIDPNTVPLRSLSRNELEAFIAATNAYVLCYDNVSGISDTTSDILCRLSSGGGYAVRAMYSNAEENLFQAKRPQLLTGITDVVTRGDLAERTLPITLKRIDPSDRQTMREIDAKMEALQATVLGALLDAAADGLVRLPNVTLSERPRLGDLAEWATACEPALGLEEGAFLKTYAESRRTMIESAVEDDPLAEAVRTYVTGPGKGSFEGTATDLLEILDIHEGHLGKGNTKQRPNGWPRNARSLSGQLRRIAPALRELGLTIELDQRTGDKHRRRMIRIEPPDDIA